MIRVFKKQRFNRGLAGSIFFFLVLVVLGAFMVLPLVFSVVNAFKPLEEFFIFPPKFYVVNPTLDNFRDLFALTSNLWVPFSRYVFNSVFVSVTATIGHLLVSSMAAYVLSKHEFKGKKALNSVIVVAMMFSSTVMAIPQYLIAANLGFIDTYLALITPILGAPLGVFLMRQYMEGVPHSIIESARLDGAGEMRICWRIIMPSIKPAWITVIIFTFQNIWNSSGGNLIYSEQIKVLPTVLSQISSSGMTRAGVGAAVSLFLMIPPVLVFVITQSQVVETMASSGIKE